MSEVTKENSAPLFNNDADAAEYDKHLAKEQDGFLAKRLAKLVQNLAPNQRKGRKPNVDKATKFLALNIKQLDWLLYPFIQEKGTAMLYAPCGIGKTFLALSMALAVSAGKSFLHFKAEKPRTVLYIDGEMSVSEMQTRIKSISLGMDIELNDNLSIWNGDRQGDEGMPNLITPDGRAEVDNYLKENPTDLLILDNLSVLFNGVKENDAPEWAAYQNWLLSLRRKNIAVLTIDHSNKMGGNRGSSKKQDILTAIIGLQKPENYQQSERARFNVYYEKNRSAFGKDIAPFQAKLEPADNDGLSWVSSAIHSDKAEKKQQERESALELKAQGKTQKEIAEIMGCAIGKINGLLKG